MLTLGEMKDMFETLDDYLILEQGISEPFSWRGSYDEVCFGVECNVSVKECKERIQKALDETFWGYKGGEYRYHEHTPVNFEEGPGRYSDQGYVTEMLGLGNESLEKQLVRKMICSA